MDNSQLSRRSLQLRPPPAPSSNGSSSSHAHHTTTTTSNGANAGPHHDSKGHDAPNGSIMNANGSSRSILLRSSSKGKARQLSTPSTKQPQRILNVQTSVLFLCAIATLVCLSIQARIFQTTTTTATDLQSHVDDTKIQLLRHVRMTNVLDPYHQDSSVVEQHQNPTTPSRNTNTVTPLTDKKQLETTEAADTTTTTKPRVIHVEYSDDRSWMRKTMPYEDHALVEEEEISAPSSVAASLLPPVADNTTGTNSTTYYSAATVLEGSALHANITDTDNNTNTSNKNDDMDADEDGDNQDEDKQGMNHPDENEDNFGFEDPNDPCVPMAPWQSALFVTCNMIHEVDLATSVVDAAIPQPSKKQRHVMLDHRNHSTWNETQLQFLGQGWFRMAWRLNHHAADYDHFNNNKKDDRTESLILKMLRPEREFTREFYELHRRDALAMERLTHSRFVLNVYGYCGQSALNELANFRIPQLATLEKFDRQMRHQPKSPRLNRMKLKLAASVAAGLAHVHEIPVHDPTIPSHLLLKHQQTTIGGPYPADGRATMVHYDINPRNVAIVAGAMPRLNDFNVARFLRWNPATNDTCGFESTLHEPWWRAPEEVHLNATSPMLLDEKVDLYALGNVLFHILTTHAPRGKMKRERMELVRPDVLKGVPPGLPAEFVNSNDPSIVAFRRALDLCFAAKPSERGTARDVSNILFDALLELTEQEEARAQMQQVDLKDKQRRAKHDAQRLKRRKGKHKRNRT